MTGKMNPGAIFELEFYSLHGCFFPLKTLEMGVFDNGSNLLNFLCYCVESLCFPGPVCVTPTTATLYGILDNFLLLASRREPNVGVYEWVNSSVGGLAAKAIA
jgi:hypothetical protein